MGMCHNRGTPKMSVRQFPVGFPSKPHQKWYSQKTHTHPIFSANGCLWGSTRIVKNVTPLLLHQRGGVQNLGSKAAFVSHSI